MPADPDDLGLALPPVPSPVPPGATIVHPGAASGARRWPAERFAAVASAELEAGRDVVVTGSAAERELAAAVAGAGVTVLAGETDLLGLAATIARAGRVVCGRHRRRAPRDRLRHPVGRALRPDAAVGMGTTARSPSAPGAVGRRPRRSPRRHSGPRAAGDHGAARPRRPPEGADRETGQARRGVAPCHAGICVVDGDRGDRRTRLDGSNFYHLPSDLKQADSSAKDRHLSLLTFD